MPGHFGVPSLANTVHERKQRGSNPDGPYSQPSGLADQRPYPPGSASDDTTNTRRMCASHTETHLSLPDSQGIMASRSNNLAKPESAFTSSRQWAPAPVAHEKTNADGGSGRAYPGIVHASCTDANQGRMMQTSPGCARGIPGSAGRSHLRDRNNGYVVVTERQKSGSILEPHRFESGPLHGGSRVNSDVGSGRTAPARSDLAQRVRHGI